MWKSNKSYWGIRNGKDRTWVVTQIQTWGYRFLLYLLVKVDALGAEDSAVGGGWGLQTGIEARERPKKGKVFKVS